MLTRGVRGLARAHAQLRPAFRCRENEKARKETSAIMKLVSRPADQRNMRGCAPLRFALGWMRSSLSQDLVGMNGSINTEVSTFSTRRLGRVLVELR